MAMYQIGLVPVHVKRSKYRVQWADDGSREFDPDDWSVDSASFRELTRNWKPTINLFAHTSNTKCAKSYAYRNPQNNAAVDMFTQSWWNEIAWICPPTHLISDTLKKAEQTTMMAILVCPAWRLSSYWNTLFLDSSHAVESSGDTHIQTAHNPR